MKAEDIVRVVKAEPIQIWNQHLMSKDYTCAFASDLMSDALAMIQDSPESTVLITGLCNSQVLRTAEMLDIEMIIFVRGKVLGDEALRVADEMGFNIFTTKLTMYEACGQLYEAGLRGING
ncbi:MAG: hypothetical protein IJ120_12255 [Solobacterium sp.]|nr:hypothetical protein [Solobacterium sp.]